MPAASPIRAGASSPDERRLPLWCADGDYGTYFDALAQHILRASLEDALDGLHRLLVHVPASITVAERIGGGAASR